MNYFAITKDDMLNGEGLRVVLWVAGCEHHCKGCHNPYTHDVNGGIKFGQDALEEIFKELEKDYISGFTASGGDPLHPKNRYEMGQLCKLIKEFFPNKTIWLYTGYTFEQVKHLKALEYTDVLVDGKFVQELADVRYKWAGSTNQRIINVQDSLKLGKVVLED